MNPSILYLLGGLLLGALIVWFLNKRQKSGGQDLLLIQKQIDSMNREIAEQMRHVTEQVNARLKETNTAIEQTHRTVGERMDTAAKAYATVNARLAELQEANKRIYDIGRDISSLQEILRAPKLRGTLGEFFLGDLLAQILPPEHFSLQHRFKSGEAVDAVVRLRDNLLVPIDAKFPLENFKKLVEAPTDEEKRACKKMFLSDVKKHIDKIAKLYILPDEGTLQVALMYIPAENVYYETIIKEHEDNNLLSYAHERRVIPVSPNTFYVYLQTIILGLRGMQIERSAQDILKTLGKLHIEFGKMADDFNLVGKHLTHAKNSFDDADKRLEKFSDHLEQVTSASGEKLLEEGDGKS